MQLRTRWSSFVFNIQKQQHSDQYCADLRIARVVWMEAIDVLLAISAGK